MQAYKQHILVQTIKEQQQKPSTQEAQDSWWKTLHREKTTLAFATQL